MTPYSELHLVEIAIILSFRFNTVNFQEREKTIKTIYLALRVKFKKNNNKLCSNFALSFVVIEPTGRGEPMITIKKGSAASRRQRRHHRLQQQLHHVTRTNNFLLRYKAVTLHIRGEVVFSYYYYCRRLVSIIFGLI